MAGISLSGEFHPPLETTVKQYKVVSLQNKERFEEHVSELLNAGWECQGGVTSAFNDSGIRIVFHQAMVRETTQQL